MSDNDQQDTPKRSAEEIVASMKKRIPGAKSALDLVAFNLGKLETDEEWAKSPALMATHLHDVFAPVSEISDLITELLGVDVPAAAADEGEGEGPAVSE